MIDAVILAGVLQHVERQVDRLAHLACLEQRGIALGRDFYHLILGGRQHQLIFARLVVGTDGHRVAGNLYAGSILIGSTERIDIAARLDSRVHLVAYHPGGVVTLQLHHNLEGIAQVVGRQRRAQGLATLNVTTHYAAAQHHSGRVPEHVLRHVLVEDVFVAVSSVDGILVYQESVFQEDVTILYGLHIVLAGRYAQLEGTLRIGGNHLLAGIVHHVAVELERYALHRHRRAVIIDVTREDEVGVHPEVEVLCPVGVLVEGHRAACVGTSIGGGVFSIGHNPYHIMAIGLTLAIDMEGQIIKHKVAGVIGGCFVFRLSTGDGYLVRLTFHYDAAYRSTVTHAHITLNHTRHGTATRTSLAVDGGSLALIDALHPVVVVLLCEYGLILVEQLVQVSGYRVGPCGIGIAGMLTAQYAEVVEVAG